MDVATAYDIGMRLAVKLAFGEEHGVPLTFSDLEEQRAAEDKWRKSMKERSTALEKKHKGTMELVREREKKRKTRAKTEKPKTPKKPPRPKTPKAPKGKSFKVPKKLPRWALPVAGLGALGLGGLLWAASRPPKGDIKKWAPSAGTGAW